MRFSSIVAFTIGTLISFVKAQTSNLTTDDTSSAIEYHPRSAWRRYNATGYEYNTTISSTAQGSYATFMFTGIAIYFVTSLGRQKATATVILDGEEQPNLVYMENGELEQRRIAWYRDDLAWAEHNFTVVQSSPDGNFLDVDAFIHTVLTNGAPLNSSTSGSSSGPTPGNSNQESDDTDGDDSGSDSNNTGAIAGGTVGGVAGVGIIAALIWYLLRRNKMSSEKEDIRVVDEGHTEEGYSSLQTSQTPTQTTSTPPVNPFIATHTTTSLDDSMARSGHNSNYPIHDPAPSYADAMSQRS